MGAKAYLIGRAFLYGLGAMGEAGVLKTLEIICNELDVSMALTGVRDVGQVGPQILKDSSVRSLNAHREPTVGFERAA